MTTTPTFPTTLDYMPNRLQHDASSIRPIAFIDDYNPVYLVPDYGLNIYWDTHSFNQLHLYFYHKFDKPTWVIYPDSHETNQALTTTLPLHVLTHAYTNVNLLINQFILSQRTRFTVEDWWLQPLQRVM